MKTLLFEVRIKMKGSPTIKEVSTYIKEALKSWGGSLDPEDNMFSSNIKSVGIVGKNFLLGSRKFCK